jgi:hypothetical protein
MYCLIQHFFIKWLVSCLLLGKKFHASNKCLSERKAYQAWLNQPPIQFPLFPESPIQNLYSNTSSSHVGDEGNDIEVGMDDFL